jgi:O-methyltransferase
MGYKIIPVKKNTFQVPAFKVLYNKYRNYTMISEGAYIQNLQLAEKYAQGLNGDVIECGVWKGGMSAGLAELLGANRKYYLFDSFEGLPGVKEIDGAAAQKWQQNTADPGYYDNCRAELENAEEAMNQTMREFKLIKGWFNKTLPDFEIRHSVALLRLDGDWYDSTMDCLRYLYPKVVENGLILIDDYYAWDGCSRAVHDYLAQIKSASRIRNAGDVCYIIKTEDGRK